MLLTNSTGDDVETPPPTAADPSSASATSSATGAQSPVGSGTATANSTSCPGAAASTSRKRVLVQLCSQEDVNIHNWLQVKVCEIIGSGGRTKTKIPHLKPTLVGYLLKRVPTFNYKTAEERVHQFMSFLQVRIKMFVRFGYLCGWCK